MYNKNFVSLLRRVAIATIKEKENANMSFAIFTPEAFPRCLDFPPFFLLFVVLYIYILYASFLSNKN